MRLLRYILLGLLLFIAAVTGLLYLTGNDHIPRGLRFTYLMGRSGPEIDDRDFFPSARIPALDPQPWPVSSRFGQLALEPAEEQRMKDLHSVAFVVLQDDSLIFEQYWKGWNADSVSNSFSVAKSYVSLLAGIALQEGEILDVLQPVGDFLPEYKKGCYARLNIEHVLTMSTGLDWSESGRNPFSDNARGYYGTEVRKVSLEQPCRDEPGAIFDYISGGTQIMAEVIEAAYKRPLDELVREKIWAPLGAEHEAWWGKDRTDGDFKAFCCLYATARDFARIGQLWLDSGVWKDRRIIPHDFWQASITPARLMDKSEINKRYGYFWWIAEAEGEPVWYCRGFHGQYVVVLPNERLVFVRTGMKREEVNATGHPTDVFEWISIARALTRRPAS